MKNTSMPSPVESLGCITCYSSSSPRSIKSPSISIRTTVKRSTVYREDLKPYWKSEKRPHFSKWSTSLLFISSSKTLLITERRLNGRQFLPVYFSQHSQIQGPPKRPSTNLENKIHSDTYWRVQLVWIKVYHCNKFRTRFLWQIKVR